MGVPKKTVSRPFVAQWLWLGSALALLFTLIAINLYRVHGRIALHEQERLAAQARVVVENIDFQLSAVSSTLGRMVADMRNGHEIPAHDQVASYFSAVVGAMPAIRSITILDAQGNTVATSRNDLIGRNFGRRAYFGQVKNHPDPNALYVSSPFNSVLNLRAINLSRMIPGREGEFAGMVSATLDPKYFSNLITSVLYAPDMWGMLMHVDGEAFVTEPVMGDHASVSHAGHMVAQRTINPARLKMDKPLVITLGRDRGDIFLQWRQDLAFRSMIFALVCVGSFMVMRASQSAQRRSQLQKASAAAVLAAAQANYQLIVENTTDLVAKMDSQGRYTYLNQAFDGFYGKAAKDRIGEYFAAHVVATDRELAEASFRKLSEPPHALSFTQREITLLGIRHLQWTAKALIDQRGEITEIIAIGRDMTEHMHRVGTLEYQAYRDFLTGLANRRHFISLGKEELNRAIRYGKPPSLLMLDLDHFKRINDAHGHRVGDLMLQACSQVLLNTLRTTDIVARMGGEEFAVLLPETALNEAIETAYRLKKAIAESGLCIEKGMVYVTASIGVAAWCGGTDLDGLLDMADAALYQAKHSGRNNVCVADVPEAYSSVCLLQS